MNVNLTFELEKLSKEYGFDDIGFTKPFLPSSSLSYYNYLAENNLFGDMSYLAKNDFFRKNPLTLVPNSKSVIVLAVNYYNNYGKNPDLTISKYALLSQDYHIWFKKSLKSFAKDIKANYNCDANVFVDTSPVMEKLLASYSSVGWQGKHSCIVSRKFSAWFFLGFIFTDLNIVSYDKHKNYCGKCNACVNACPTGAIDNYKLDIKKCIAYYNIEHKGFIKEEIALKMGSKIFGCDDCLSACVWNKFAKESKSKLFACNKLLSEISLKEILLLNEDEFLNIFNKTPIKRLGLNLLKRNGVIVALNTKNTECMEIVKTLVNSDNDILKQTANWALSFYKNS